MLFEGRIPLPFSPTSAIELFSRKFSSGTLMKATVSADREPAQNSGYFLSSAKVEYAGAVDSSIVVLHKSSSPRLDTFSAREKVPGF